MEISELEPTAIYSEPSEQTALEDPLVKDVVNYLNKEIQELIRKRYPTGHYQNDDMIAFDEGWMLRRPIEVKMIIDYLRRTDKLQV